MPTVSEQVEIIEARDAMRAMACERLQDEFAAHRSVLFSAVLTAQLTLFAGLVHAVRAAGPVGNLTEGNVRYTGRASPPLLLTLETNVPQTTVLETASASGWLATLLPDELLMLNRTTPHGLLRVVVAALPVPEDAADSATTGATPGAAELSAAA